MKNIIITISKGLSIKEENSDSKIKIQREVFEVSEEFSNNDKLTSLEINNLFSSDEIKKYKINEDVYRNYQYTIEIDLSNISEDEFEKYGINGDVHRELLEDFNAYFYVGDKKVDYKILGKTQIK